MALNWSQPCPSLLAFPIVTFPYHHSTSFSISSLPNSFMTFRQPALKKWSKCKQDFPGVWEEGRGKRLSGETEAILWTTAFFFFFFCPWGRSHMQKEIPQRVQELSDCFGLVYHLTIYSSARKSCSMTLKERDISYPVNETRRGSVRWEWWTLWKKDVIT